MSLVVVLFLLVATPAYVDPDDRVISLASELDPWCRTEAEARLLADGKTTYGWTSSHLSRGNVLHVEGRLRVQGADVAVNCRIVKGARLRYAAIEIKGL
jgi:hypothetical protein